MSLEDVGEICFYQLTVMKIDWCKAMSSILTHGVITLSVMLYCVEHMTSCAGKHFHKFLMDH